MSAAKDDDVEAIESLLAEGWDINAVNVIGQNALHVAALWGNLDVAESLLLAGCDMDAQNNNGMTPLHFASANGMTKCVRLLLEAGADPTLTTSDGRTPCDIAENNQVMRLLSPPLEVHDAVKNLDVRKLKDLMGSSSSGWERPDVDGNTALHLAVIMQETDPTVSLELVNGVCGLGDTSVLGKVLTKRSTKAGRTPLHLACQNANVDIVKALIDAGELTGVGRENLDRRTTVAGGFVNGQWGKKDQDGQLSYLDNEHATPLHVVFERLTHATDNENTDCMIGQEEIDVCRSIFKLLMQSGANIDALDGDGATALHHAIASDLADAVDILLSNNASLQIGGKFIGTGNNALHQAVRVGNVEMVSRIITQAKKKGLDIDAFGAGGWSPLGLAVRVGNTPIVDALLAAGARGNVVMGNCKSPIDIARVNNRVAILEAIEKSQVNEA